MGKILIFAGSTRKQSLNARIAQHSARLLKNMGIPCTLLHLSDFPLPLYQGDEEEAYGVPKEAIELKKIFIAHPGFFVVSPEYNSSFPPLLKNVIDWVSRPHIDDEHPLIAFREKVIGLASASPGKWGGIRSITMLRTIFMNIGAIVSPTMCSIPHAHEALEEDGSFKSHVGETHLKKTLHHLVSLTDKISAK